VGTEAVEILVHVKNTVSGVVQVPGSARVKMSVRVAEDPGETGRNVRWKGQTAGSVQCL
jgi:hypothetical protein